MYHYLEVVKNYIDLAVVIIITNYIAGSALFDKLIALPPGGRLSTLSLIQVKTHWQVVMYSYT